MNKNSNFNKMQAEIKRKFIYFEKQSNDRLCGVHCLNMLLQGPYFDPFSLGEIAQGLDRLEQELYKEDSGFEIKPKISYNCDDDGNYNVQVLSEALKIHAADIVSVKQNECEKLLTESLDSIQAFIFNSSTHWFSIRKIENIWFNLNSTNPGPGPQIISDFYLSAFIKGTEELGYTNFLVKNVPELPPLESDVYKSLQPHQKLVSFEEIKKYKPKKINMGDTDDQALEKAIELSKKEMHNGGDLYDYIPEETNYKDFEQNLILEDEIKFAMEVSLNEYLETLQSQIRSEPSQEEAHFKLYFNTQDKKSFERRFYKDDKIKHVSIFCKITCRTYGDIRITGMKKNKIYIDMDQTLEQAGVEDGDGFIVKNLD
jgi:ataxin-3